MAAMTSNTGTVTRLDGQRLWVGRLMWAAIFLLTTVLFIYVVPIRFDTLNTLCESDCQPVQISAEGLANIKDTFGLSLSAYAVIIIFKEILLGIIYITAGAFVFWRRSDDWLVIFISLTLILMGSVGTFNVDNVLVKFLMGVGFAFMTMLSFVFPDGRFVPHWTRWIASVFVLFFIASSVTSFFQTTMWAVVLLAAVSMGFSSQIYRYRNVATPIQRQQTKWIMFSFGMIFGAMIFLAVPLVLFPSISAIAEPTTTIADFVYRAIFGFFTIFFPLYFLPIAIAFSTLRYRLWDADPIINRSLVYGVMTAGAVLMIFGITILIQFLFGDQQPLVAIAIAGAICVSTFNPAYKRIQHLVDRYVYGFRFDLNELKAAQKDLSVKNPGALTGRMVDGYEIQGIIGKGGMGEIYRGFGNDRVVAIKTMLPDIAKDPIMQTRFQREAEAGQRLNHPNIAKVYASGILDDTPYLIMEYVEGIDLGDLIKQDEMLEIKTTTRIMQDVCAALGEAHTAGFIHRDIKPSNIMIRGNGQAVLMDFGITKLQDTTSALTGTGVIGTIDYMAPEQISSAKEIDHRADIYALGVMLYEMLTGEKPFSGGPAQIMFAHLQQPPPYARAKNDAIEIELAEAIEKAMDKDPDHRFQSTHEFSRALAM